MFKIDRDLSSIASGVWAQWQGSQFKIAHISNMKFQRALAKLQQPHRLKLEKGTLDPKINRDLVCQAMAEGVLLDWKEVGDANGVVEYSVETAHTALKNDPEFRDFVSDFASNLANYRDEEVEELGNGS